MFLGLDLPPAPLFHDELQQNVIPQVRMQLFQVFNALQNHLGYFKFFFPFMSLFFF